MISGRFGWRRSGGGGRGGKISQVFSFFDLFCFKHFSQFSNYFVDLFCLFGGFQHPKTPETHIWVWTFCEALGQGGVLQRCGLVIRRGREGLPRGVSKWRGRGASKERRRGFEGWERGFEGGGGRRGVSQERLLKGLKGGGLGLRSPPSFPPLSPSSLFSPLKRLLEEGERHEPFSEKWGVKWLLS